MQQPLQLTKEEQLRFMRALYSVFYRDKQINSTARSVLDLLNQCFHMSTNDYQHYVHVNVADIAKEINAISDSRVRIYFMRIIHDVYLKEIDRLRRHRQKFFVGIQEFLTIDYTKGLKEMYGFLQKNIDIKG
ncbi:MAG: hypothetical protein HON51_09570 [Gammaproteobacteria bacterium]|jgi:hypothetical protein|nr:hypothetical protein [Gammaproteobacteria bacterium]MBT5825290.1 hypothetical protein [Gammaproteobacteria bacterium]MBT6419452.1 hypothetical protein [Gammaproteobacteria bacterium]MBT6576455.1 hypothetical protein [Gammaproteobacteria bacterium]MBT7436076.1 hypothetical protein [Gammaproteobacteria bacterium]